MNKLITIMVSLSMLVMALVIWPDSSVKPDVAEAACYGSTYVRGYYSSNGTYVRAHYRTCPDRNPYNNYSFPGNYNPNTGRITGGSQSSYLNNYGSRGYGSRGYGSSGYSSRDYGSSGYGSSGYGSIYGGR